MASEPCRFGSRGAAIIDHTSDSADCDADEIAQCPAGLALVALARPPVMKEIDFQ
jgi:hypothetical protein